MYNLELLNVLSIADILHFNDNTFYRLNVKYLQYDWPKQHTYF